MNSLSYLLEKLHFVVLFWEITAFWEGLERDPHKTIFLLLYQVFYCYFSQLSTINDGKSQNGIGGKCFFPFMMFPEFVGILFI